MDKKQYNKANKRIAVLATKKDKTDDEIREALKLVVAVQKYELKKLKK